MRKRSLGLAAIALSSALSCMRGAPDPGNVLPHEGPPDKPAGSAAGRGTSDAGLLTDAGEVSDAEIAAALVALSRGAVAEAEIARSRSLTFEVQDYAARILVDHGAALERQAALWDRLGLAPTSGSMTAAIDASTSQQVAALGNVDVDRFDATFLSAQVAMRSAAISLIDLTLTPQARNTDLGRELATMRALFLRERTSAESLGGFFSADGGADGSPDAASDSGTGAEAGPIGP